MKSIRLLLVLLFFPLAGCVTGPGTLFQRSTPTQAESVIYIYRVPAFWGAGMYPDVEVDGKSAASLPNGSYLLVRVSPGPHVVKAKGNLISMTLGKETSLAVESKAGEEVFVRFRFEKEGDFAILGSMASSVVMPSHIQVLHRVETPAALGEISALKLNSQ